MFDGTPAGFLKSFHPSTSGTFALKASFHHPYPPRLPLRLSRPDRFLQICTSGTCIRISSLLWVPIGLLRVLAAIKLPLDEVYNKPFVWNVDCAPNHIHQDMRWRFPHLLRWFHLLSKPRYCWNKETLARHLASSYDLSCSVSNTKRILHCSGTILPFLPHVYTLRQCVCQFCLFLPFHY